MIIVGNVYLSDDIAEQYFVCKLSACKGACCVEGDAGAPLEEAECETIAQLLPTVRPYLSQEALEVIEAQGTHTIDQEGDLSTPILPTGECVYAFRDEKGQLKCAFEQAYYEGKSDFKKPVSCHLYPIRITRYDEFDAVNYHRWEICKPACAHGSALRVPLYRFLKEPLIRKYGKRWYDELCRIIELQFGVSHTEDSGQKTSQS